MEDKISLIEYLDENLNKENVDLDTQYLSHFPLFEKMINQTQYNPHHCYNLWGHTLHSINAIGKERKDLRWVMLFHDAGKPYVVGQKQNKTVGLFYVSTGIPWQTFYNHALKSVEVAREYIEYVFPEDYDKYLYLIKNHDIFMNFRLKEETSDKKYTWINKKNLEDILDKSIKEYPLNIEDTKQLFLDLVTVSKADALAQADIVKIPVIKDNKQDFNELTIIDTKEERIKRLDEIERVIETF